MPKPKAEKDLPPPSSNPDVKVWAKEFVAWMKAHVAREAAQSKQPIPPEQLNATGPHRDPRIVAATQSLVDKDAAAPSAKTQLAASDPQESPARPTHFVTNMIAPVGKAALGTLPAERPVRPPLAQVVVKTKNWTGKDGIGAGMSPETKAKLENLRRLRLAAEESNKCKPHAGNPDVLEAGHDPETTKTVSHDKSPDPRS